MAQKYWYLLTSYPSLRFGEALEFSVQDALHAMDGVVPVEKITCFRSIVLPYGESVLLRPTTVGGGEGHLAESQFLDPLSGTTLSGTSWSGVSSKVYPKLGEWQLFEESLRWELRTLREQRKRVHETPIPIEQSRAYGALIKSAFEMDSPLEMEIALDQIRWNRLEELLAGEFYTEFALIGYLLQLKIIERHTSFSREYGEQNFKKLFSVVDRYIRERRDVLESGE